MSMLLLYPSEDPRKVGESFISIAKQYHVPNINPNDEKTQETTHHILAFRILES